MVKKNLIGRAKLGFSFNLSVHVCVCMSVYLFDDYGHTPVLIVMKFGTNILGTKVERFILYVRIVVLVSHFKQNFGIF